MLQLAKNGGLLSRDAVYTYLDPFNVDSNLEQVACEYVVKVTDENTDVNYMQMSSVSIPTKVCLFLDEKYVSVISKWTFCFHWNQRWNFILLYIIQ